MRGLLTSQARTEAGIAQGARLVIDKVEKIPTTN
jgi:hypothetical protein